MATVQGRSNFVEHSVLQSTWVMGSADTGTPEELARFPFHSIQMGGTFSSATVIVEGSDDNVTYFTLTGENPAGGADVLVSATSATRFDVQAVPRYIRPRSSGGSSTAVTVIITSRSYGH